jgi:hypothetical protein
MSARLLAAAYRLTAPHARLAEVSRASQQGFATNDDTSTVTDGSEGRLVPLRLVAAYR